MKCEVCDFENPKGTVTAIILKDNKTLVLKRNQEPYKGTWDLPGGYMNRGETPEETTRRELKEELGCDTRLDYITAISGTAQWKGRDYPIINHIFLAELRGDIVLNDENSEYEYVDEAHFHYDSVRDAFEESKRLFNIDLKRVDYLTKQLDPTAKVDEYALYRATLNGHLSTVYEDNELMGLGWIFPRQTMLRKQAVVEDMIVDEKCRGKGYGLKILEELLEWCKTQNVEMVELTTNPLRVAAHKLYEKVGFKIHPTDHMLLEVK